MNTKKRRIFHSSSTKEEPYVALILKVPNEEDRIYQCTNHTNIRPPDEWKDVVGTIKICEGVLSIASRAFMYFKAHTYILPSTLTQVGSMAFMHSSVVNIDFTGLDNCVIKGSAFAYCTNLTSLCFPRATSALERDPSLQSGMCSGCTSLQSVTFRAYAIDIGDFAFDGCTNLLLSNITAYSIGQSAFRNCSSLTELMIGPPSGYFLDVQSNAFYGCIHLSEVRLNFRILGAMVFSGCPSLTTVIFNSPKEIPFGTGLASTPIYLLMAPSTFADANVSEVIWTYGNTDRIEEDILKPLRYPLFKNSSSTKTIKALKNVQLNVLTEGTIPGDDNDTDFPMYFANYNSLTTLNIPSRITNIPAGALANCELTSVTCNAVNPPTIHDSYVFGQNENLVIYVPLESIDTYKVSTGWSDYSNVIYPIQINNDI